MTKKTKTMITKISAVMLATSIATTGYLMVSANTDYNTTYYTVVKGDTLNAIARRFNTTVTALVNSNGIPNKNLIYVNQVLRIPDGSGSTGGYEGDLAYYQYRVVSGDNLYRLAIKYNTSVAQLATWNGITNTRLIHVGDVLQVMPVDTMSVKTSSSTLSASIVEATEVEQLVNHTIANMEKVPVCYDYLLEEDSSVMDVAAHFDVAAMDLIRWNIIDDPMVVPAGTVLQVYLDEYPLSELGEYEEYFVEEYFAVEYPEAVQQAEYEAMLTAEALEAEALTKLGSSELETVVEPVFLEGPEYVVEITTSVIEIAKKFENVTAFDLIHWNMIDDPMAVPTGTVLRVEAE